MQQPEKFKTLGITPPKGCLMYGPPGARLTELERSLTPFRDRKDAVGQSVRCADQCLLSEACGSIARSSQYGMLQISELIVQMYIGDGAKLVRDAFELAKQKAPAIIFIDELDAVGTKRFDSSRSGDREVQRTMLELLNQLDGFSSDARIKVWRKRSAQAQC